MRRAPNFVQVQRALPAKLWAQVLAALDDRCDDIRSNGVGSDRTDNTPLSEEDVRQWRTARGAILLMGDSGLRRAEAALARREDLRPAEDSDERHSSSGGASPASGSGGAPPQTPHRRRRNHRYLIRCPNPRDQHARSEP